MNPSSSSAAVLIPDQEGHGIRVLVSHDENIENTSSKLTRINTSPQSIGRKNSFFRRISVTTGNIYNFTESCFDGVHNKDETDIDCGGSCQPCRKYICIYVITGSI